MEKEQARLFILGLVQRFDEQFESYKNSDYNETQTRRDFIDPFFKALGWDVDNQNGYAEAYREVIHEDKIKISGAVKAPDYSFRLAGGKRLFFVEAKKPSIVVKDDIQPAYQVRRYGWSAKHPISIITDFEEFAIYDCTKKPNISDKASVARIKYLTYKDYLNEFEFLWDTFSKERVLKGSFDKFVQSDTHKKGTTTVDKEFLLSLDNWRTDLAVNISKNNQHLDEYELNFVVQQAIDRIIFLRIAEDRCIEPYGTLNEAIKQGDFYKNLFVLFEQADQKYNSGLFDLSKDKLSRALVVENKVIKKIIKELYYPDCPYEFSVLSVEILGSAYEQFLGKIIRIDKNRKAKIEEKPEVRKAGGVYYTPQYIVDYIVKNTVGKLIDGKTPHEIEKLKIVDPACGSGSFLIGAYQYLMDYHKNYYTEAGTKTGKKGSPVTPDGNLTSNEKKRILLNNIHGVDIDTNAVEVTKLSLLLKCMEGENETSLAQQYQLWHERILPTLDNNIKSGNSLIDTDIYDTKLDFGEDRKIKPFNWQKAFPEVFKQGGFDAVIGNPPYVRQELLGDQKEYFAKKYKVFHGMSDLYSYFIEKGIGLLKTDGIFGIIVANKWMRANYGEPLRIWLKKFEIKEIIDFGDLPVFQRATTYPCILICMKNENIENVNVTNVKTLSFNALTEYVNESSSLLKQNSLADNGWNLSSDKEQELLKKIHQAGIPLSEYVNGKIYYGIKTGLNDAFVIDSKTRDCLIEEDPRSAEIIKPFLAGKDIKRYQPVKSDKYLIFTRRGIQIEDYPAIKKYLTQFKKRLMPKPKDFKGEKLEGRKPGSYKWYEIQDAVDYYEEFEKPKICWGNLCIEPPFNLVKDSFYVNAPGVIISSEDLYLLGLMNSSTLWYFLKSKAAGRNGGYIEAKPVYVSKLPIRIIDKQNPNESKQEMEIISLVQSLLEAKIEIRNCNLQEQKVQLQSRIDYYENKINELVYTLYEITEEERNIIENNQHSF